MGKAKVNIPICAALVLLFLTMVSIHMTSGLYARYTSTSTASDSARVAKFDVDANKQDDVTVICDIDGDNGDYVITVNNKSEVAIKYNIDLVFDKALFAGVELKIGETKGVVLDDKTVKFSDVGLLAPGGNMDHTVTFHVTNWETITKDMTGIKGTTELSFTARVHAVQVD